LRALTREGMRIATRRAMIATTTSTSIKVKPARADGLMDLFQTPRRLGTEKRLEALSRLLPRLSWPSNRAKAAFEAPFPGRPPDRAVIAVRPAPQNARPRPFEPSLVTRCVLRPPLPS